MRCQVISEKPVVIVKPRSLACGARVWVTVVRVIQRCSKYLEPMLFSVQKFIYFYFLPLTLLSLFSSSSYFLFFPSSQNNSSSRSRSSNNNNNEQQQICLFLLITFNINNFLYQLMYLFICLFTCLYIVSLLQASIPVV